MDARLQSTISATRLDKYLVASSGDLAAALDFYEFNSRLSEAFYTPLQSLEICMRNTIDCQLLETYGPAWFDDRISPLAASAQMAIRDARGMIRLPDPIPRGSLIAELKFSFWVGLLGSGYDASLWRRALYRGFRAGGGRRRADVHGRFNALRRFRNRVAHHEPIFHRDPVSVHAEILEAIGWMDAETKMWTQSQSRVPVVIAAG